MGSLLLPDPCFIRKVLGMRYRFYEDILKSQGILLKSMIVTSELLKCFFGFADGVVCRRKFCLEFLDVELVWKWFISKFKIITVDHS